MADTAWKTAITEVKPNELRLRGYRIDELMGARSFPEAVWLAWMGELPRPEWVPLITALFTASIDHGVTPPSALSTRVATGTGAGISQAVAAGVLSINASHGGAIEGCMRALHCGVALLKDGADHSAAAGKLLAALKAEGKRMPGFGHRVHSNDPRTARLRELSRQAGVYGDHLQLADAIEEHFQVQVKPLPLNVDGAVAAVLCELGVDPLIGNAYFILPRVAGLVAHFAEERTRERIMRRIDQSAAEYNGPSPREVGGDKA
jgi:citrate synthase